MTNFEVLREFATGRSETALRRAVARSGDVVDEMRNEGTPISYLGSDVFVDEYGLARATLCRYDADSEATVTEHSQRADLPVRSVLRRGEPMPGIAPAVGVVPTER